jgi:hypothetical protein
LETQSFIKSTILADKEKSGHTERSMDAKGRTTKPQVQYNPYMRQLAPIQQNQELQDHSTTLDKTSVKRGLQDSISTDIIID